MRLPKPRASAAAWPSTPHRMQPSLARAAAGRPRRSVGRAHALALETAARSGHLGVAVFEPGVEDPGVRVARRDLVDDRVAPLVERADRRHLLRLRVDRLHRDAALRRARRAQHLVGRRREEVVARQQGSSVIRALIVRVFRSMATVSPYGRLPPLRSTSGASTLGAPPSRSACAGRRSTLCRWRNPGCTWKTKTTGRWARRCADVDAQ